MKKSVYVFLSFILLVTMLAGCGSDQASNEVDQEQKSFSYAMSGTYKPFNYKDGGELKGFDVEIAAELADRMGMQAKPITTPWETILEGLKRGNYDAIIGSMAITEERLEQVDFSKPYYRSGAQVFVMNDNNEILKESDLEGKRIGVVKASTFKSVAEEYTDNVKEYASDVLALQDLPSGRIDAVLTDQLVGLNAINENGLNIKPVDKPLWIDEMAIPVQKGNKELIGQINSALDEMIEDGTYEQISKKWFGKNILE